MSSPAQASAQPTDAPLVRVRDVKTHFVQSGASFGEPRRVVRAVDGVSFTLARRETLGLVGESGCGKSTLGRSVLRLVEPTSGRIEFEGRDITALTQRQLRPIRSRMQIIFQDPYGSLNPRMTVGAALREALCLHRAHRDRDRAAIEAELHQLTARVGLRPQALTRYPHEFSGGQRQRIGIARALAVRPQFVVADEPVSALDLSIQAQIVNLLMDLQDELGLSYLFIAHDLKLVEHISHRIAVMYLGRIVELMPRTRLSAHALHPYTRALQSSVPEIEPRKRHVRVPMAGELPSPLAPPTGCAFHPRCPHHQRGLCDEQRPELRELAPDHWVACHLAQ